MRISDLTDKQLVRAKDTAYRYLSYRPRSRAELEAKLHDKGFDDAIVAAVLVDLARLGYVDDERFASQWAEGRIRLSSHGKRRIARELAGKGVDRTIVLRTLTEVLSPDKERELARQTAERKLLTLRACDHETRRRRLSGFLERKGFSYEVIRDILTIMHKGAGFEGE